MAFKKLFITRGFTLIELAIAISVGALLTTFSYPFLMDFIGAQKVKSVSEELTAGFNLARAEAVKRNDHVYMTALGNAKNSAGWKDGWRIWVDVNSNQQYDPNQDTELLAKNPLARNIEITSNQNLNSVRYNSTGFADRMNEAAFVAASSSLVICVGEHASRVIVHRSGRVERRTINCPGSTAS